MRKLKGLVPHVSSMDKTLESLDSRFESSFYEIEDIASEFKHYQQSLVFDPERLSQVQDRLELIGKLKKKYVQSANPTVLDLLEYQEKASQELECLTGAGHDREALQKAVSEAEKAVYQAAKKLSALRKAASDKMSAAIEGVLVKLGMKETKFCVHMQEKDGNDMTQKCGPYGMDDIEFLISSNPGSPMLPLARIASGGELSRVMLALKTILSNGDLAGTLVFDEIDTGIGGEVAVALGDHMKLLAAKKQILCITHLASIAVYADNQIKIQKGVDGSSTSTTVFPVAGEQRVREIARMLSGDADTAQSLEHARAMLEKYSGGY